MASSPRMVDGVGFWFWLVDAVVAKVVVATLSNVLIKMKDVSLVFILSPIVDEL